MLRKFETKTGFKISLFIIAFLLASSAYHKANALDGETLSISFDKDFSATSRTQGTLEPNTARSVKLVDGIRGKGVMIPQDGELSFDSGSNINADKGSVSMWIKPNWGSVGRGAFIDRPGPGEKFYKTKHAIFNAGPRLNASLGVWLQYLPNRGIPMVRQIFKNEWLHLVFTWDDEKNESAIYMNGRCVDIAGRLKGKIASKICFGSSNGKYFGFDGVMDEIKVFDRALSETDAASLYSEFFPIAVAPLDYAGLAEKAENYRMRMINLSDKQQTAEYTFRIHTNDGKLLKEKKVPVRLAPKETKTYGLDLTLAEPGDYRITATGKGKVQRTWELAAISPKRRTDIMPISDEAETQKKLVQEIDCSKPTTPDGYADDDNCRIVEKPFGKYRETTLRKPNAGFAYKMNVKNPGRPHWLEVDYPDDSDRIYSIVIYPRSPYADRYTTSGNLDCVGVLTSGNHTITNKRQQKRILFWPDSEEIMVGFFSFKETSRGGAAAMAIRLYENDGPLPKLNVNKPENAKQRTLAIWQEDPTMTGHNWFSRPECYKKCDYEYWRIKVDRMIQYARYIGKNRWSLLLFDYFGDNSDSQEYALPISRVTSGVGRVPGWSDITAVIFEREELPFMIEFNQRDSSNKQHSDKKEYGSITKLISPDKYSKDFADAARLGAKAIEQFSAANKLAERRFHGRGRLNPLHPVVQDVYLKMVKAYAEKFNKFEFFRGINIISPIQLDFIDSTYGYGDYNTELFVKETSTPVPQFNGNTRFSKRYEWIKENAWEKWLIWRSEKIGDFYKKLLKELNRGTSGKQIVIRQKPGTENPVSIALGEGRTPPMTLRELWLERGINATELEKIDGLVVEHEIRPNRTFTHSNNKADERYYGFSPELADFFTGLLNPAVLLHQHCNLEIYWSISNSPIKKFWATVGTYIYDNRMISHFATPQPINRYVLENMAWTLAETDMQYLDHGFWGCPENGAMETYRPFHKAYLSLPRLPFAKYDGTDDPVTLRIHNSKAGHWFYMVNKSDYPAEVNLSLQGRNVKIEDAVSNDKGLALKTDNDNTTFSHTLAPYEVFVGKCGTQISVAKWQQTASQEQKDAINEKIASAQKDLQLFSSIFGSTPRDARVIVDAACNMLDEGKITQAEHRLQSRTLQKLKTELAFNLKHTLTTDGKLVLEFFNTRDKSVSGSIRLVKWPEQYNWEPKAKEISFSDVAVGSKFSGAFEFKCRNFHTRAQHRFDLELRMKGETPVSKRIFVYPYMAKHSDAELNIDGDLDDWSEKTMWHRLSSKRNLVKEKSFVSQNGLTPYQARFACIWNESGLSIAAVVKDKDYIAPEKENAMWRNDSLQIYFDQMNNKSPGYDDNDLVYQIGEIGGQGMAWRETAPSGQKVEQAARVKVAVKRVQDETHYEIFFPSSEFTRCHLYAGSMLGFSFLINNRDRIDEKSTVRSQISTSNTSSFRNPQVWRDLILTTTLPSQARVILEGKVKLSANDAENGKLTPISQLKKKHPKRYECSLNYNSTLLSKEWNKYSFEFTTEDTGVVRLSLTGRWAPKNSHAPKVWFRDVKITGVKQQVPALDKWKSYKEPVLSTEGGFVAARSDSRTRHFTDLPCTAGTHIKVSFLARGAN